MNLTDHLIKVSILSRGVVSYGSCSTNSVRWQSKSDTTVVLHFFNFILKCKQCSSMNYVAFTKQKNRIKFSKLHQTLRVGFMRDFMQIHLHRTVQLANKIKWIVKKMFRSTVCWMQIWIGTYWCIVSPK